VLQPAPGQSGGIKYIETKRVDHVDTHHGTEVADPYRWLEDDVRESEEVAQWVADQNKITMAHLDSIPQREAIEKRLTELWNFERFSSGDEKTYIKAGQRYFFFRNDGLQNQSVLYTMNRLDDEPSELIDPNKWSDDGTVALREVSFSDDGEFLAYSVAEAGSDWRTWKVMNIGNREILDDALHWVKFSGITWTPDGEGFFYGRYNEPEEGAAFQSLNFNQKLFYHRVGTDQSKDLLVYERPDRPEWRFSSDITADGRYLIITVAKGTDDRYRIIYKDLTDPYAFPLDLIDNFDTEYTFVGSAGSTVYFLTELEAPRRRLIATDLRNPDVSNWHEVIPQTEDTLVAVNLVGNLFFAEYLQDAKSKVRLYTTSGRFFRDVELPGIGSIDGFKGRRTDTETFYTFSNHVTPPGIYRYDILTGESSLVRRSEVKFDPDDFEVKQVFYTSKDGTRIPMFIANRKGLVLNGENPTLLYGYGGFDISMTPSFRISRLGWMDMGGVLAIANLRGGGEYGEEWHNAGTKLKKQNVFDDFIAAAEWLIDSGHTKTSKLAIQGGSNGGLLIGAVMNQRPGLFGAGLPAVGVMDMLRFHKFTAGQYWVDDYGSAENEEEFKALYAYSPYHNVRKGTKYPPTLVTTADTDDRVVPGHSFKYAAALQWAQAGAAPVLIRIETRAGHGGGTPTSKRIEQAADSWAFLAHHLGM
jgi:prolyl oligopeptidase